MLENDERNVNVENDIREGLPSIFNSLISLTLSPSLKATELLRTPVTKIPRPNSAPPLIIKPSWSSADTVTRD